MSEELLDTALKRLTKVMMDLIYADPHQWSTRPCQTCKTITALNGAPFGCVRYAQERAAKGTPT